MMVAVTLVAGAAVFGFVNGQAASSEGQYGQAVAKNVNYLNEHYEMINEYYSNAVTTCSSGMGCFFISFYNNGNVGLTIAQITITNSSDWCATNSTSHPCRVGWFKVSAYDNGTVRAYNKVGAVVSSCTAPVGYTTLTSKVIAENSVPPTTYTVMVPACSNNGVVKGATYTIQAVGFYGNVAKTQIEASW